MNWIRAIEQAGAVLTDAGHKSLGRNPQQLRQICAWCKDVIRDGALPESHGICPACSKKQFPGRK